MVQLAAAAIPAVIGAVSGRSASKRAASAQNRATDAAARSAREQLEFQKQQYGDYLRDVRPQQLEDMKFASERARTTAGQADQLFNTQMSDAARYRDRYWGVQTPLEDEIIGNARRLGTQEEQNRLAGLAMSDTRAQFGMMRSANQRATNRLTGGPTSPAAQMLAQSAFMDEALGGIGASQGARFGAYDRYQAGLQNAAALGRGLPGFAGNSSGGATQAGGLSVMAAPVGVNAANTFQNTANSTAAVSANLFQGAGNIGLGLGNGYANMLNTMYNSPLQTAMGGIARQAMNTDWGSAWNSLSSLWASPQTMPVGGTGYVSAGGADTGYYGLDGYINGGP